MVRHLLASTLKGVTVAAVALPGLDWLTEVVLDGFDVDPDAVNAVSQINVMANGGGKSVASFAQGVHDINEQFAHLAAQTGNVIQVNRLAGVQTLTAEHFTDNFGIIPKVLGNAVETVPEAVNSALAEENRAATLTGLAVGGVGMAMLPNVGNEVNFTIKSAAGQAMQMANRASHAAQEGAGTVGKFTQMVTGQREAAAASPTVKSM